MVKQAMFLFLLMGKKKFSLGISSEYEDELKLSSVKQLITQSDHNLLCLFSYFQWSNTHTYIYI